MTTPSAGALRAAKLILRGDEWGSVAQQTERDGIRFKMEREVEHWRKAYNEQVIKAHEACEREQAWKTQYRAERNMLRDMMSTYCPKEVFKEEFPD